MNWEITPTLIVAIVIQIIVLIVAYTRTTEKASAAFKLAEDAKMSVQALNGAFNLFQVSVAREYVSREVLKEFEIRITNSAKENVDRLAREISELREVIITGRGRRQRDGDA